MTLRELLEQLAKFQDLDREVLVPSSKSDPLAYKEKYAEPQVFLRDDGVIIIRPRERGYR